MAWSLLNHGAADKVAELLDEVKDNYPPEVTRFFPREKAEAIIHAALWGHSSRVDGTAGCYAFMNLMDALGFKGWTYDAEEAAVLTEYRTRRAKEAALAPGQHAPAAKE
jgi:hypothetical protein